MTQSSCYYCLGCCPFSYKCLLIFESMVDNVLGTGDRRVKQTDTIPSTPRDGKVIPHFDVRVIGS